MRRSTLELDLPVFVGRSYLVEGVRRKELGVIALAVALVGLMLALLALWIGIHRMVGGGR